jgi:hypothetical protein
MPSLFRAAGAERSLLMSNVERPVVPEGGQPLPGFEPWLVVCLLAFVPGALIVILPRATLAPLLVPICVAMGALLLAGLGMLVRSELKRPRAEERAPDEARRVA